MEELTQIIVVYSIGDGCTFSATETKPALAVSLEAFLEEFELSLMAEIEKPGSLESFVCGHQEFRYRDFLYSHEIKRPHTVSYVTEYIMPDAMSVDMWFEKNICRNDPSHEETAAAGPALR